MPPWDSRAIRRRPLIVRLAAGSGALGLMGSRDYADVPL